MLQAEAEWMLACLEIDKLDMPLFDEINSNGTCNNSKGAEDDTHVAQTRVPQPLPPLLHKKGIHCSEDLSVLFGTYRIWLELKLDVANGGSATQVGIMKDAKLVSRRLHEIGVPEVDICVLNALLVEETKLSSSGTAVSSDMLDVSAESIIRAVKIWRLVSYCKQIAMVYCSHDKMVVADLSKADKTQNSLNVFEFDCIESVLAKHDMKCIQWKMDVEADILNVQQMSPFDAVGKFIRRLTCIAGVPFSYLQGMSFLSTNGGFMCDTWVLEPTLSTDSSSFYSALALQATDYIKSFMLQGYLRRAQSKDLLRNCIPSHVLSPNFVPGTLERIITLCKGNNLNHMLVPIELLRDYCDRNVTVKEFKTTRKQPPGKQVKSAPVQPRLKRAVTMTTKDAIFEREEVESAVEYTHAQITLRFWTGYRQECIAQTNFYQYAMEKRLQHYAKQDTSKLKCNDSHRERHRRGRMPGEKGGNVALNADPTDMMKIIAVTDSVEYEKKSKEEEAAAIRAKKITENSVFDLLNLEKSVAGFTDMIDTAVSDEQDVISCPSAFVDTIGVIINPMKDHDAKNTVETALQYEPTLHHPLEKTICVWTFCHHKPYTIEEVKKIVAKEVVRDITPIENDKGRLNKYYPSYIELRRRMELSLLLQYSVSYVFPTLLFLILKQ